MVKTQCLWDVAIKIKSSIDSTNVLVRKTFLNKINIVFIIIVLWWLSWQKLAVLFHKSKINF